MPKDLVTENDPELMRPEEEQEIREDKKFCPLCAKYRDRDKFLKVQTGPIVLIICPSCNIVLHNLNVIVGRAKEEMIKQLKKTKVEENEKRIIIPKVNIPIVGRS